MVGKRTINKLTAMMHIKSIGMLYAEQNMISPFPGGTKYLGLSNPCFSIHLAPWASRRSYRGEVRSCLPVWKSQRGTFRSYIRAVMVKDGLLSAKLLTLQPRFLIKAALPHIHSFLIVKMYLFYSTSLTSLPPNSMPWQLGTHARF